MIEYGHFTDDGREYIVTRPETPRPWINYLSNERFCSLCSHTGGGYSFFETSGYNRITMEHPALVLHRDAPGRYIYLRDAETGEYWTANWQPVRSEEMRWESAHGLGYTRIRSAYGGIEAEVTYFVPRRDDTEVWMITLRNTGTTPRRITSFSFVEWSLANYAYNLTEAAFAKLFNEVAYEEDTILVTSRFWNVTPLGGANPNIRWDKRAYMTSSLTPDAYDTLTEEFIGVYRGWHNPIAVERGLCSNSLGDGRDIVGVLQHNHTIAPGDEVRFVVLVGVVQKAEDALAVRERYNAWEEVQHALAEVNRYWDDYTARIVCHTPDPDFDLSFNTWNKYQAWVTSRWSRMDSYYIGGGSIVGFRDSWQDMLGVLPNDLEWARERVLYLLEHQFPDGSTLHNWDPLTNIGVRTGHSDDPLWLVLGVIEYVRESGNVDFLDYPAPYYDGGAETVRQHVIHAIEYTLSRMSPRTIPLIEAADWNDGLDQVGRQGRGESVMVAEHLVWMLADVADLFAHTGREDLAKDYLSARDEIIAAVNEHLWDGEWYARGVRDDGQPFGSSHNQHGRIYLNAQSWAVMSGLADSARAEACMNAVEEHLDTEFGPAIFLPAYTEPNPKIGIITRFAPGTKENGAIFNHPVCWAIMALCILGRGDAAFDMWSRTSFIIRGRDADVYRAEPYVYSEYVHGADSVSFGEGEFSWMTGTAAWMWKVCLERIMGVRPTLQGLLIDPCIPSSWSGYTVSRRFRGSVYQIRVSNPERVCRGVTSLSVDGDERAGQVVPAFHDGKTHLVDVTLGAGGPQRCS